MVPVAAGLGTRAFAQKPQVLKRAILSRQGELKGPNIVGTAVVSCWLQLHRNQVVLGESALGQVHALVFLTMCNSRSNLSAFRALLAIINIHDTIPAEMIQTPILDVLS
jgi:hypothetical protein